YPVGREAEIARQLLSLREQLAELKALEPVAEVVSKFGDPEAFGEREIEVLIDLRSIPYGARLFTAAKPEALPRHIFSMLVNELRDVPAIGCKRELIISVLNRHGVIAEPVQCDPPATE
ncbi:polyphosphate kinase, partial [Yersinia bercovieri]|uniref:polyphosphate kinase n=2 Tax=Yersinia TaxID=629 RepID=UPI0011A82269